MSITVSSPDQILRSPVNASKAKFLYSFPKCDRFKEPRINQNDKYYDIPNFGNKRTTSFGYGSRHKFIDKNRSPPPNSYNLPSDFMKSPRSGKAFSFGICREAYSKVYIKAGPPADKSIPGPGSYEVRDVPGRAANKYSFRPRTVNPFATLKSKLANPGPGTYEPLPCISPKGDQFVSTYKSSLSASFHPPNSRRFKELRKEGIPGPGQYDPKMGLNNLGEYFLSTYKSSLCRTFSQGRKNGTESSRQESIFTPGPGTYRIPSEFGYYEASQKYRLETDRIDHLRTSSAVSNIGRNVSVFSGGTTTSRMSSGGGMGMSMNRSSSQPEIRRGMGVSTAGSNQGHGNQGNQGRNKGVRPGNQQIVHTNVPPAAKQSGDDPNANGLEETNVLPAALKGDAQEGEGEFGDGELGEGGDGELGENKGEEEIKEANE